VHDIGCDRRRGQGSPLLDDFGDISCSGSVDDLEVDELARPELTGLRQGCQPIAYDSLAGARQHRRIDEIAHGSAGRARPPSFIDLCRIERPRAAEPLDVPDHRLVIHEPLQSGVHGFLDGAGAGEAPGPLQEMVIDVDESLCHEG
jgi:hypothetical protein